MVCLFTPPLPSYSGTKLYCLVTEVMYGNDLPKVEVDGAAACIELTLFSRKSHALTTTPPSHMAWNIWINVVIVRQKATEQEQYDAKCTDICRCKQL